jgi:pilus assembly protein FimV
VVKLYLLVGDALKRFVKAVAAKSAWHRKSAVAILVSSLLAASPQVWALSLGRINVQSALGETLRAEIEVTSMTPEEAAGLEVKIAPPQAYQSAGVEYSPVLSAVKITLHRRSDGRAYLKMLGNKGVQEPFVDVILESTWSTGRLVREYTLLFDPPVSNKRQRALEENAGNRAAQSSSIIPPENTSKTKSKTERNTVKPERQVDRSASENSTSNENSTESIPVRKGDTLTKLAAKLQREGVSLDQMIVGLFRANPDAFIGNNMNRLKSGVSLAVPSADLTQSSSANEARQFIRAQSENFSQYRRTLAGAVSTQATPIEDQKASGKVQAQVNEQVKAAPNTDKLTLSKSSVKEKSASATTAAGAGVEQKIAKAQEEKDSSARVAELSRNLDELNKLKRESGAAPNNANTDAISTPASSSAGAQVPIVVPVMPEPPKPQLAATSAVTAEPQPSSSTASGVGSALASQDEIASAANSNNASTDAAASASLASSPAGAESSASEAGAASAVEPPSVPVAVKTNSSDPGLLNKLLNSAWVLPGVLALVALLMGLGLYRIRNRRGGEGSETSFLESRLQQDSFFGASGGQRVDTHDASNAPSSMSYSLSQLDAIGDVDPVAEADVYLAYGRDLQAEEILKEAMRSTPDRLAIRLKLLEVYAKRRDTKGFEVLAEQLYGMASGQGDEWERAQALGLSIDPENPLYQPGGKPSAPVGVQTDEKLTGLGPNTISQPLLRTASHASISEVNLTSPLETSPGALNFDLKSGGGSGLPSSRSNPISAPNQESVHLDFPNTPKEPSRESLKPLASDKTKTPSGFASLDLSMAGDAIEGQEDSDEPTPSKLKGGLEEISRFDFLDEGSENKISDPLVRKIELAEEFIQIGDVEGARDLLKEVIAQANGALKTKAQTMLDNIA